MHEDRSGNDCRWRFRSLVTCVFAGQHGAGRAVPSKQRVAGSSPARRATCGNAVPALRTALWATCSDGPQEVRVPAITLGELINSWLIDLRSRNLSAKTISTYGSAARRLETGLP